MNKEQNLALKKKQDKKLHKINELCPPERGMLGLDGKPCTLTLEEIEEEIRKREQKILIEKFTDEQAGILGRAKSQGLLGG